MSFRKPFRAVPIRLGPVAQARRRQKTRRAARSTVAQVLLLALLGGLAVGSVLGGAATPGRLALRQKAPPAGAYYPGCNAARADGVAPLYRGEPGYRPELDGDSDGIACEPHRGF